jgi:hypothetical protein
MNYLNYINDQNKFKDSIKQGMDKVAFTKLEDMKREIANQILQSEDQ